MPPPLAASATPLKTAAQYAYEPGVKLMDMSPMAMVEELRRSVFPATNYVGRPAGRINGTQEPARVTIKGEDGKPRGHLIVTGPRRERHRRFLDYLTARCRPIPLADGSVAFLVDPKRACQLVFQDKYRQASLFKIAAEMQDIRIAWHRDGRSPDPDEVSPLCTLWMARFDPASPESEALRDSIAIRGFEPAAFAGYAVFALGRTYVQHLALQMTVRYGPALDTICRMTPAGASIARLALTHKYLRGRALDDVLDAISAPSGHGRRRDIQGLMNKDLALLRELGVELRPLRDSGRLAIWYEPVVPTIAIVSSPQRS